MQTADAVMTLAEATTWARTLYDGSVDHKDAAGFAAVFTDDATLCFANNPPITGRDAIREAIAGFFTAMESLRHESRGLWCQGDAVILQAVVTYTRWDGGVVSVPAVTIFRMTRRDGAPPMAHRCDIFVDLTPLFAPSATESEAATAGA